MTKWSPGEVREESWEPGGTLPAQQSKACHGTYVVSPQSDGEAAQSRQSTQETGGNEVRQEVDQLQGWQRVYISLFHNFKEWESGKYSTKLSK